MSRAGQSVIRVLGGRSLHLGGDDGGDVLPGFVEAAVHFTARADVAHRGEAKVQVGDPVLEVRAAPEGEHDVLVGRIDGDESGGVTIFASPVRG